MPRRAIFQNKKEKGAAVFVVFLMAAAIALPIYINSLENTAGDDAGAETKDAPAGQSAAQSQAPYIPGGALQFSGGQFMLDGSNIQIVSGAMHYFRTVPEYWTDRLQKMKACGLNAVETYVPWNLHEEHPGQFNFQGILDVRSFIQKAHELGLYVIFRPGPFICSEWDFGGLPAWLLHDPDMKVRSGHVGYMQAVENYFTHLLPLVEDLQYSKGGPIIAFQLENEFGSFSSNTEHLKAIKNIMEASGINELFFTSDNSHGIVNDPFYTEALPTANFKEISSGRGIFNQIHSWSGEFPLMVTEFWTGWFDHWSSGHGGLGVSDFGNYLQGILEEGASVNFYMFHGGTNFGFMNGANHDDGGTYKPTVSSYDYDALLTEKGDITPKYLKARELILKYVLEPQGITADDLPAIPADISSRAYGSIPLADTMYLPFEELLNAVDSVQLDSVVPMEMLDINGGYGQNYGYIVYRKAIPARSAQLNFAELPDDRAQIFVDGVKVGMMDWDATQLTMALGSPQAAARLDILVENHGRVNYGSETSGILNRQRKGLSGDVTVDGQTLTDVTAFPLEFKTDYANSTGWMAEASSASVPAMFKTTLDIDDTPEDTFIFMKGWGKGIVFVNNFNLGRYWSVGPQQTLYIPAPLLKTGSNSIVWFEQEKLGEAIVFTDTLIIDVNDISSIHL